MQLNSVSFRTQWRKVTRFAMNVLWDGGGGGGGCLAAVTKKESIVNMASRSVSSTCYKSLVHSSSYIEITSCVSSSASLLILLQ